MNGSDVTLSNDEPLESCATSTGLPVEITDDPSMSCVWNCPAASVATVVPLTFTTVPPSDARIRNVSPLSLVLSGTVRNSLPQASFGGCCSTTWSQATVSESGTFAHSWPPKTATGLSET